MNNLLTKLLLLTRFLLTESCECVNGGIDEQVEGRAKLGHSRVPDEK